MANATIILVDMNNHGEIKSKSRTSQHQSKFPSNLLNSQSTPHQLNKLQPPQSNSASTTLEPMRNNTTNANVIRISTGANQALASLAA